MSFETHLVGHTHNHIEDVAALISVRIIEQAPLKLEIVMRRGN